MEDMVPKRILIVDDEEVVRSLCTRVLTPLGYSVETASDGDRALSLVASHPVDLIITDYRMPGGLDGLELGDRVRRRNPNTRIILMTAFPAIDNAVRMLRMGASDYLIKPFEKAELIQCVQSSLAKPSMV